MGTFFDYTFAAEFKQVKKTPKKTLINKIINLKIINLKNQNYEKTIMYYVYGALDKRHRIFPKSNKTMFRQCDN
jgi:hypothetical protein